jgi:hypothetical protein
VRGYLDTTALGSYRAVQVCPWLPDDEAWTIVSDPGVLFVGLAVARHPEVLARLVADDRERLVQVQE